jgi:hypothetical protein
MMEVAHVSEISVRSKETTWRYIADGSHIHARRRENLKSHMMSAMFKFAFYMIRARKSERILRYS